MMEKRTRETKSDVKIAGCSRREFLKEAGKAALAASLVGSSVSGCTNLFVDTTDVEWSIKKGLYNPPVESWDPVYGPPIQWYSRYGGPGDFQGHKRGGAVPGIDYDVPTGTPLVPPMTSYLRQIERDRNGALYILFYYIFDTAFRVSCAHLEEVLVDEEYILTGDIMKFLGKPTRALGRGEMIALSGNSGKGPTEYGGIQPPHLHLSLYYWNGEKRILENIDPEKFGFDRGRPVFWDGDTVLDVQTSQRPALLEKTVEHLEEEMDSWPETKNLPDLKGVLMEYRNFIGNSKGRAILDSKHFHDMRSLLKRVTLEEKKYGPGTGPYRLMMKIIGYSTDEKQKLILTLPFISPNLRKPFKKPNFKEGPFFTIQPAQEK